MQEEKETQVWSLGGEDALEEAMEVHSSILAWIIPQTEEPGRLQSTGSQRVGHSWSDLAQHSTAAGRNEKRFISCERESILGKGKGREMKWSRSVMSDSLWPHGPGFSIHEIFQASVLEWVTISFSKAKGTRWEKARGESAWSVQHLESVTFTAEWFWGEGWRPVDTYGQKPQMLLRNRTFFCVQRGSHDAFETRQWHNKSWIFKKNLQQLCSTCFRDGHQDNERLV